MRLDGFGLFVDDMPTMVRFYRDVLGFEIKEGEGRCVFHILTLSLVFLLYGFVGC